MKFKRYRRKDGQEIIKVYLDTNSNNPLIVEPYCYVSAEDEYLLERIHINSSLYVLKSEFGKQKGLHTLVTARKLGISVDEVGIADHINGVHFDNTRFNLRATDMGGNAQNRGWHFSTGGDDRRLGLDILDLEMKGIITVEQGDEIYNQRVEHYVQSGINVVDYLSFAYWFYDTDLRFYGPDLYDYIPDDMLRVLVKNSYHDYHRLDVLEYTMDEKMLRQMKYENNQKISEEIKRSIIIMKGSIT